MSTPNEEDEISILRRKIERLKSIGDELNDEIPDPPSPDCRCHLCAPCDDCVNFSGIRQLKAEWKEVSQS